MACHKSHCTEPFAFVCQCTTNVLERVWSWGCDGTLFRLNDASFPKSCMQNVVFNGDDYRKVYFLAQNTVFNFSGFLQKEILSHRSGIENSISKFEESQEYSHYFLREELLALWTFFQSFSFILLDIFFSRPEGDHIHGFRLSQWYSFIQVESIYKNVLLSCCY